MDPLVPYSPYFYMFAFGEMLSDGRPRGFQISWITVAGFLLLPLACFPFLSALVIWISVTGFLLPPPTFFLFLFTLVYWYLFLRNLQRQQTPIEAGDSKDEAARDVDPES